MSCHLQIMFLIYTAILQWVFSNSNQLQVLFENYFKKIGTTQNWIKKQLALFKLLINANTLQIQLQVFRWNQNLHFVSVSSQNDQIHLFLNKGFVILVF